ncbi:MAG: alpha/beta fold hydrolase [Actinomycetota bacterium]
MSREGRLVPIDDCSLWVLERGPVDGFPLIVVHGGPGLDHHEFGDYLDPLTEDGIRLVFMDLRANGMSDRTRRATWTLERQAQDVIMLALNLRLGRYAVLGHSYGAFVALQNAVDYPGQAAATIVSGGIPSVRFLEGVGAALEAFEPTELREQVRASWEREAFVQTSQDVASLMRDQWPFHFADPTDPRIADYEARTADTVFRAEVLRHVATAKIGGIDVETRLAEVTQPTLVLAGRYDRVCPVAAAELMARLLPKSELHVFEKSAHMAFVEQPEEYVETVRAFLANAHG